MAVYNYCTCTVVENECDSQFGRNYMNYHLLVVAATMSKQVCNADFHANNTQHTTIC